MGTPPHRHPPLIHLIWNVKVALLPTTLRAAIDDAPLDGRDGANVPPNIEIIGTGVPVPVPVPVPVLGSLRNGAFGRAAAIETLRNGAYAQKSCFLNARY